MANLSQTAGNVAVGASSTVTVTLAAGETITQGQPVYQKSSDLLYYKADANASLEAAGSSYIALTPASASGYFVAVKSGLMNLGATLTVGTTYVVSATAGAICPIVDLTTGDYVTILGTASTSALLSVDITATGIVKP